MIIRKNSPKKQETKSASLKSSKKSRSRVIKKEDIILNVEEAKNTNEGELLNSQDINISKKDKLEEFEKIDITSIEFKERVERRRGERRRGYRRIDERSLVSRAQQEAHTIKELAAREGYQNGIKKAQSEIEKIKESLEEFLTSKEEMYQEFYPHVLEISLEIAKKIIKREVETSNDILKDIIMETLEQLNTDTQKVEIKVNSADVEFARASLPEIMQARNNEMRMIVSPDDTIDIGSCVVVANNGVIDANFKTQLNVLQSAFGIYQGGL